MSVHQAIAAWRAQARRLADEVLRPAAAQHDREATYPLGVHRALVAAGLYGLWIPQDEGGRFPGSTAGGVAALCAVVEELSKACGGMGVIFAVNALGSYPLLVGGTATQRQHWLPRIASGACRTAFALSEAAAGSDVRALRTTARREGSSWRLKGTKKWTTNAGEAELYTVFARSSPPLEDLRSCGRAAADEISAFLVHRDDPGVRLGKREDTMGIRCVPVRELHLDEVLIPEERLLGGIPGQGFAQAMRTLELARPGVAAQAIGLAQGALDLAVRHVTRREQFGRALSHMQCVQSSLANMDMQCTASRSLLREALEALAQARPDAARLSAMCKCHASDTAMAVTTQAVQLLGGYGYLRDHPLEKAMRDAKITQIYEGTNPIQRQIIARELTRNTEALSHLDAYLPDPG